MTDALRAHLNQIRERAEAATAGPWKVWAMAVLADPVGDPNVDTALPIAETTDPHRGLRTFNADFIAAARRDVPVLLAAVNAVLDLHVPLQHHIHGRVCEGCTVREWVPFPCDTYRAVSAALGVTE
jgi:hypothetical protein